MRKLVLGSVLGLALLVPCSASAQLFLGARLGYSFAGGDIVKGEPMKHWTAGMIPLQVDFGLDIAKAIAAGVYVSAGYTVLGKSFKELCDASAVDCSGSNVRLGAQGSLHATVGTTKVWGGVLLGWEQQNLKESSGGDSLEARYRGVEAGLQGGLDFATSGQMRWGPYVSVSIGEYKSASLSVTGLPPGALEPIVEKAQHRWVGIGLRGVLGL